jgi:cytochrome c551/c552
MKSLVRFAAVAAILLLAGCGGGQPTGSTSGPAAADPKPATTTSTAAVTTLPADLDQGPRAGESPADHEAAERGEKLFQNKGCSACHAFGVKKSGPDLAGVAMRRTGRWIESQILHPDVMVKQDPIARELFAKFMLQMPNQGLAATEAKDVVEYLKQADAKSASASKEEGR